MTGLLITFNLRTRRPFDPAAPAVDGRVQPEVAPAFTVKQGIEGGHAGQAERDYSTLEKLSIKASIISCPIQFAQDTKRIFREE